MALGYKFDLLQTAIDRGIRDSIVKNGIASGEFSGKNSPSFFSAPPHTEQHSLGKALVGAAVVAVGGLLLNWLTVRPDPRGCETRDAAGMTDRPRST